MVEPAARGPSQHLAAVRDQLFAAEILEKDATSLWGPCLHAGKCPLGEGRDWCHFSVPAHIPGNWFTEFSKGLGSEKQWVKFSYLWLASRDYPSQKLSSQMRRVISDPLTADKTHVGTKVVLLCEPDAPVRHTLGARENAWRGDLIHVSSGVKKPAVKPKR